MKIMKLNTNSLELFAIIARDDNDGGHFNMCPEPELSKLTELGLVLRDSYQKDVLRLTSRGKRMADTLIKVLEL